MRKCTKFSPYIRRPLVIYDLAPDPSEFPICEENFILFFISVGAMKTALTCTYLIFFKPPKCSFCHSSRTAKPQVHGERLIRGVTPVTDTVQSCKWGFQRTGQNIPPLGGLYFFHKAISYI